MKIAFPTNNGKRINAHFGYATHYLVVTVENGAEIAREMREKDSHAGKHDDHHHDGNGHGHQHNHGGTGGSRRAEHGCKNCAHPHQ